MRRRCDEEKPYSHIRDDHLGNYIFADIFTISELLLLDKNDCPVQAGYLVDYLCFLVNGEVIISSCSINDKNTCTSYCRQLIIIGEAASLWQTVLRRSVKALTRCICAGTNLTKYRQILLSDLLFLQNICQILTCKLNSENELFQTLSEPLEVRLSRSVLTYSVNQTSTLQLTNCTGILNTSYRHLLRMLKCFCAMDILEKARNCYVIVGRKRLEEIANGTPVIGNPQGGESASQSTVV